MESQLLDHFLEDSWSPESRGLKPVNAAPDLWPNYLWPNQYSPLAYNFEDLQSLDAQESGFSLSESSSPPEFELPSPMSDSFSLSVEDPLDQKSLIDLWVIPSAFESNTDTLTAPSNSPSEESCLDITIPNLASSPGSPESNSHWDAEYGVGTKRPTTRSRKPRPEISHTNSPCSKRQNAHNLIEKRYRNNLNSKISTLRNSIPSLRPATKESEEGEYGMDIEAGESKRNQKCNKGIVLDKAIEYIAELEKQVKSVSRENAALQLMIKGHIPTSRMLGLRS